MVKVIWKGEDHLHSDDRGGPSFTVWNGVKFPKGIAVEVTNPAAIAKAKANVFFDVVDEEKQVVKKVAQGVAADVKTVAKAGAKVVRKVADDVDKDTN